MTLDMLADWASMGGNGFYVWGSYALAAIGYGGLCLLSRWQIRRAQQRLGQAERETHPCP